MDLNKILITGADGTIGNELDFGIKVSRKDCDVTDPDSIASVLEKYKPHGVLCLASIPIQDCEKTPSIAMDVNSIGLYNVAVESRKKDIATIMISSGALFNSDSPSSESDMPQPLNIYSKTKYLGEILLMNTNPKYIIARTGWLFGFRKKKNFFNNLMDQAKKNQEITATYDQFGSPTYIRDFIAKLKELIEKDSYGTYHVVNEGSASAFDIAQHLKNALNSTSSIKKVSFNHNSSFKRSPNESLVSEKLNMRDWKSALDDFLSEYGAS